MNERDTAIAGWNLYGMNEQGAWCRAHRAKRVKEVKTPRYALCTLRYAKSDDNSKSGDNCFKNNSTGIH